MTTRYLSVFFPRLPTDRLTLRAARRSLPPQPSREAACSGSGSDIPLVTVLKVKGAQRIAAADAAAARAGIKPGMGLGDARALCPALDVAEADPAAEALTLGRLCDWARRFTPLAGLDGADGLLLDITGAAHLFGGEDGLLASAETGLDGLGFTVQGAVASTPEAAWAFARFGTRKILPPVVDEAFERTAAALPVAALRLDPATVASMAQAGLRRVGDLALRPRAPLTARFGPHAFDRLDGLFGRQRTSISPRFEAPVFVAERRFASGITRQSDVEAVLLPLARHLCTLLSRAGQGARQVEATLFRVDGVVMRLAVGTSRPNRDPQGLVALFRERLASLGEDGLDTGYGFDLVRLGVTAAEGMTAIQPDLVDHPADREGDLAALADRLGARLGRTRVLKVEDRGSHVPEHAAVAVSAAVSAAMGAVRKEEPADPIAPDMVPSRPIRLFDRPEPVEAIAHVPDGPPIRFRWRRMVHEVAASEGPERIAPEWWREQDGLTRDYFRVEDKAGRRFWLYREGLLGRETARDRWFLHGLFG